MRRLAVAVLIAASLAGCGGGNGSGAATPSELAQKIGCTGYKDGDSDMFSAATGECSLNGTTIYLHMFRSDEAAANWAKVADGFGGVYVRGDHWVVEADNSATADAVVGKVGGVKS